LQNDWYPLAKFLPENNTITSNINQTDVENYIPENNTATSNINQTDIESYNINCNNIECNNIYDETINYFLDPEEEADIIEESTNELLYESTSKAGRKRLIGGPSEETFFTLSHTLRAFSELIPYLLEKKNFKYILTGQVNNDLIEMRFSLNRYLSGNHLALDVSIFFTKRDK